MRGKATGYVLRSITNRKSFFLLSDSYTTEEKRFSFSSRLMVLKRQLGVCVTVQTFNSHTICLCVGVCNFREWVEASFPRTAAPSKGPHILMYRSLGKYLCPLSDTELTQVVISDNNFATGKITVESTKY